MAQKRAKKAQNVAQLKTKDSAVLSKQKILVYIIKFQKWE